MIKRFVALFCALLLILTACQEPPVSSPPTSLPQTTTTTAPQEPIREMRAAWVSYFELDAIFASSKTEQQVRERFDEVLDTFDQFHLNTMFFHVRANSDAYYISSYFEAAPQAKRFIDNGFDPLAYMIEKAHEREIEVHAWVNPYRVGRNSAYAVSDIPTFTDERNFSYYVPSSASAQQLILNGIRELVDRYDVDGIHYDDYFYPQDVLETESVYGFESEDYTAYQENGGLLSIADWRRASVDSLVSATHTIANSKHITFGISPSMNADTSYHDLYANTLKWLSEDGYVDYICPQIYTGFEHGTYPFSQTVDKWLSYPRHSTVDLYIGIAVYKAGLLTDTYAGDGMHEWATKSDVLMRAVQTVREKAILGFSLYSYSYLTPDKVNGLSKTNDLTIAKKEMENLLTVL